MTRLLLTVVLFAWATVAHGGVFPFGVALELSRDFGGENFGVGQSVPVSVSFSSDESSRLGSFFYSEQLPFWIRVFPQDVLLNGEEVDCTFEVGEVGEIILGLTPYRWILDNPDSGGEVIDDGDELVINFTIVANQAGFFNFETDGWFGALIDSGGQAAMGYDDYSPQIYFGTVDAPAGQIPQAALLEQAWPNPFNPRTNLSLQVAESGQYRLEIFDVTGRLVSELASGSLEPGRYEMSWNGTGDDGVNRPSGLYFARLSGSEGYIDTQRLVLLK